MIKCCDWFVSLVWPPEGKVGIISVMVFCGVAGAVALAAGDEGLGNVADFIATLAFVRLLAKRRRSPETCLEGPV